MLYLFVAAHPFTNTSRLPTRKTLIWDNPTSFTIGVEASQTSKVGRLFKIIHQYDATNEDRVVFACRPLLALTLQPTLPATENGAMEKFPDLTMQVKSFESPMSYFTSDLSFCRADPKLSPF